MNLDLLIPAGSTVRIKVFRFPDRDHARAVVAVASPLEKGYKEFHLTRPVAIHSRRRLPAWLHRSRAGVEMRLASEGSTLEELSSVAEASHQGQGIRRNR